MRSTRLAALLGAALLTCLPAFPHGDNAKQFAKMVQYGMTLLEHVAFVMKGGRVIKNTLGS